MADERSTGRQPLDDETANRLLAAAEQVVISRGRSRRVLPAAGVALDDLRGPTGKYRAPILLVGSTLVVGFSADTLNELLQSAPD